MNDIIEFLKGVDWEKYEVVINIAGGIIRAGQEVIDLLQKSGMNQIEFLQVVEKPNAKIAIERARLIKSIADRDA